MLTLLLAASIVSGASFSGETDPEAVVATAPRGDQSVALDAVAPVVDTVPSASTQAITPHGLTTAEQIDRWISARSGDAKPFADDGPVDLLSRRDDRKVHGEVSASIGTGDYTAWSAAVSYPIGETGRLDLSYSQSKNSPFGYGYGYGYPGHGLGYRGAYDPFYLRGAGGSSSQSIGVRYESDGDSRRSTHD
jgi:hypothetical protein